MMSAALAKHPLFDLYAESLTAAERGMAFWSDLYRTSADLAFWWAERWAQAPSVFAAWTQAAQAAPEAAAAAFSAPAVAAAAAAPEALQDPSAPEPDLQAVPDDLTRIVGIGPRLAAALAERGITRYAQIADWSDAEAAEVDRDLKLMGRIVRNNWVIQARRLTTGA